LKTLSFLAFDHGQRRIGVASGNTRLMQGQPLKTLLRPRGTKPDEFDAIQALIQEWQPDALVVGVPFHPDGAAHDNTRHARRFARQLQGRFRLPVHEVDERYTTTEVLSAGADPRDADAAAAALILEQHLRALQQAGSAARQRPGEPGDPGDSAKPAQHAACDTVASN